MKETEENAVARFSEAMVAKLLKRRGRYKKFGWRDPNYKTLHDLSQHLMGEVTEFNLAQNDEEKKKEISKKYKNN